MRRKLGRSLLVLILSAGTIPALAQPAIPRKYVEHPGWSLGWTVGLSDLWGDVGTQSPIDHYVNSKYWDKPCFMGGMFARYTAHPMFAIRASINYGTLYANDNWNYDKAKNAESTKDDAFQRYLRNQDARANIWEGTLMVEWNPLRMNSESKAAQKRMQPYLMAGVGGFHFKPQTSIILDLEGRRKWVNTHDLHLEGEGISFREAKEGYARATSLWQICVPVGLGVKWDLGTDFSLGVEYLYRFTTTDRLDNVSSEYVSPDYFDRHLSPEKAAIAKQVYDKSWEIDPSIERRPWTMRGNKDVLDGYSTIAITFIYKIQSNKIPWWY